MWPAADVPSYQAPSQRGYADSHPDPPGVWEETRRIQRRTYRDLQTKIFKLWDEFDASETEIGEKFTESVFPS